MIIGITGTDGGGKGTVVEHLLGKGFIHCSARTLWVDEINRQGLEVSRSNMRIVANELREKHGNDYFIEEYKRRTGFDPNKNYVIESVRSLGEANTLRKYGGVLWAVDADQKIRYERVQQRRSESDRVTFDEFVHQETLEMDDPNPHGMQKAKVIATADHVFMNNGTLEELHAKVDEALASL
jgi:dephospho-CoA kinase